jgi:putative membrane protein insertion efficiency factor
VSAPVVPRRSIPTRALVAVIHFYQHWISPALPPSCRFYPSCSAYAVEALQVHGLLRGSGLTLWRLLRCAPWHPGGIDPVPPARHARTCSAQDHHEEQAPC